jgi:hypothetical protein
MNQSQELVKADLTIHPGASIGEVMARTGLTRSTVNYALFGLAYTTTETWPRRYTLIEPGIESNGIVVEPREIALKEIGPLWQNNRADIAKNLVTVDLTTFNYQNSVKAFESLAASVLGIIQGLKAVGDVPEWREEIGL